MSARIFCTLSVFCLVVTGCSDLSKEGKDKTNGNGEFESQNTAETLAPVDSADAEEEIVPYQVVYPFPKTIKSSEGKQIEVQILGKQDFKIAFRKLNSAQRFVLPLSRLSSEDQEYFNGMADGGKFESVIDIVSKSKGLEGRNARWHRDLTTAEREAEKLGIPVLLAFLISKDEVSEELEKEILWSREFRGWASHNVALCLVEVEPEDTNMAITSSMAENRKIAEDHGVSDRPTIVVKMVGSSEVEKLRVDRGESVDALIEKIGEMIDTYL